MSVGLTFIPSVLKSEKSISSGNPIRLGGPAPGKYTDPVEWVKDIKSLGYSTTLTPAQPGAPGELIKSFREEAKKNNIIIAEVGAFGKNILDPDSSVRKEAIRKNIASLQLADEIGACCCVNTSGGIAEVLNGPDSGIYSKYTFDLVIETVRYIIDQVKPGSTFYTLEAWPSMICQLYDHYFEYTSTFFAVKKACVPVHILWDILKNDKGGDKVCWNQQERYLHCQSSN